MILNKGTSKQMEYSTQIMFFKYHINTVALLFIAILYVKDKFFVGISLFIGYCSVLLPFLYPLLINADSIMQFFIKFSSFGANLILLFCFSISIINFIHTKQINMHNIFFGFCFGFFISVISAIVGIVIMYVLSMFFETTKNFFCAMIVESILLAFIVLFLLGKIFYTFYRNISKQIFFIMWFFGGSLALVINFWYYLVAFIERVL